MSRTSDRLIASVQLLSGADVARNLERCAVWIERAAGDGADLILLPEYFGLITEPEHYQKSSEPLVMEAGDQLDPQAIGQIQKIESTPQASGQAAPMQSFLRHQAKRWKIWLIGGSLPLKAKDTTDKVVNTLLAYNPLGQCVCAYPKIHLFGFQCGREAYDESRFIVPGLVVQSCHTGWAAVGASICYDLRFPELYQQVSLQCQQRWNQPMDLILMPAAFTYTTGRAHWEVLLRARAIENQCYVLAAAHGGIHEHGRHTFGHSMIIDPWGVIISRVEGSKNQSASDGEGEGMVIANFDTDRLAEVRAQLPVLRHKRPWFAGVSANIRRS